jgi:chromosome partitioning protein
LGKRVLLIDLDPQGHASLGLGVKIEKLEDTLYDVLGDGKQPSLGLLDVRIPISEGCDLIPSEVALSALEQKLAGTPGREKKLSEKLNLLNGSYDFVFIDSPPSLGLLTFNALCASQEVIIPIECSFFSLHGLARILETIRLLQETTGRVLKVHMLLNLYDPFNPFSRSIRERMEKYFGKHLFKTAIHESVRLKEAASCGQSITDYDPNSTAFEDFMNLAGDLMGRENFFEPLPSMETPDWSSLPSDSLAVFLHNGNGSAGERKAPGVLFTYRAFGVSSVQLAGDFNHWVAEELLAPIKEGGIWRKLYHLPGGIYNYKYIVDGEWMIDPQNPRSVINPFGGTDSVIEVIP